MLQYGCPLKLMGLSDLFSSILLGIESMGSCMLGKCSTTNHFKDALYGFSSGFPNFEHHYSYTWGDQ